jgi:hypothetical protein
MTTHPGTRTTTPPQATTSIYELLALPRVERLELLRAVHSGQPVPRVIVAASVLVRSLKTVKIDQELKGF